MSVVRSFSTRFSPVPRDTPAEPHWQAAGLDRRFAAATLDLVVVALLWLAVLLPIYGLDAAFGAPDSQRTLGLTSWTLVLLTTYPVAVLYLGLSTGRTGARNGQTFGKDVLDIRIVRGAGGLPLTRRRAWARAAIVGLFLPIAVPAFALLDLLAHAGIDALDTSLQNALVNVLTMGGFLAAAITPSRRAYYDWLIGTAVVGDTIIDPRLAPGESTPVVPVEPMPIQTRPRDGAALFLLVVFAGVLLAEAFGVAPR